MESDKGSRKASVRNIDASIAGITKKRDGRGDQRDFLDPPKESNRWKQIRLDDEDKEDYVVMSQLPREYGEAV